jgi:hypothetical protein
MVTTVTTATMVKTTATMATMVEHCDAAYGCEKPKEELIRFLDDA